MTVEFIGKGLKPPSPPRKFISNRLSYEELEVDLTHTKQKEGGRSNR